MPLRKTRESKEEKLNQVKRASRDRRSSSRTVSKTGSEENKHFRPKSAIRHDGEEKRHFGTTSATRTEGGQKRRGREQVHARTGGEQVELQITGLGSGGEGVGRYNNLAVFVPGALPGETVKASLDIVKKTFARGRLLRVLKASADRVEPVCPVYKECGGCQLQHLSYSAELKAKQQQVRDALTRIGHLPEMIVLPVIGAVDPWHYRNKMQVPVAQAKNGVAIGCFAQFTHKVINVKACAIQKEANNDIAEIVRSWMHQYKIPAYDEDRRAGIVRHIMGRVGVQTGELMVCLVTAVEQVPHSKELVKLLQDGLPGLTSVVQNINTRHTNVILGPQTRLLFGRSTIKDNIGPLQFNISAQSFFQVNSDQAHRLYEQALEFAALTGKETVADVYCGTGTITLFLARKAKFVYGIEIVPSAIKDAHKNAALNKISNVDFILGDAAYELPALIKGGVHPDVIVLDPPRAGCEEKVLAAMAQVKPQRIVYVSCNPATLARDLAYLTAHGFKAVKAQPVDMFSRTHHVETVALLERDKRK